MKEILIFDIPPPDIVDKKKEEYDILVEQINIKTMPIKSSITSILLQKLSDFYIPIIKKIPHVTISAKSKKEESSKIEGVNVIYTHDIECIIKNGGCIKVPKNTPVLVIGIRIPKYYKSQNTLDIYDYLKNTSKKSILNSGLYSWYNIFENNFQSLIFNPTFIYNDFFEVFLSNSFEENNKIIMNVYDLYIKVNTLVSSIYSTIQSHSLIPEHPTRSPPTIKKKSPIVDPDTQIFEFLQTNKLAYVQDFPFINYDEELHMLINKYNLTEDDKYKEKIRYKIFLKRQEYALKKSNKKKLIEINFKKSISFNKFNTKHLFELNKSQLALVNKEYESIKQSKKRSSLVESYIYSLQKNINISKTLKQIIDKISNYDLIKKDIDNPKLVNKLIKIDDDELCIHYIEQGILLQNKQDHVVKVHIKNKYGVFSEANNIYCGICGALLWEYDEEIVSYKDKDNYVIDIETDDIYDKIKQEFKYILDYYVDTIQKNNILYQALHVLIDIIRYKILDIQSDLIKIKTINDNEMWILLDIYIYIYIFAVLSQFIFTNPGVLQFKNYAEIKTVKSHKTLGGEDKKKTLDALFKNKENRGNIQGILNFALKVVKTIKYGDILNSKYITMDSIKELFLSAYKWTLSLEYNYIQDPDYDKKRDSNLKSDKLEVEDESLKKYINDQIFRHPIIPISKETEILWEQRKRDRDIESVHNKIYKIQHMKSITNMRIIDIKPPASIDMEIYGNCSKKCRKIYLYKSKGGVVEYTKKDIIEILEKNKNELTKLHSYEYMGSKCICEKSNAQKNLFYKYFEQYCPKGELHEFSKDKCVKCGITEEIIANKDASFYDKWKPSYLELKKKESLFIEKEILTKYFSKTPRETIQKIKEWEITDTPINTLIKKLPIKNLYNLIKSIGLYENIYYKDLELNKSQPYLKSTDQQKLIQIGTLHNYILFVYKNYYMIKNSEYYVKLPYDIKYILEKNKQSNQGFSKKLSDLDESYTYTYLEYKKLYKKTPMILLNFVICSFCNAFLMIYDIFKKNNMLKVGEFWCKYYIAKIIGYEKILCKTVLKNLKPLMKYQNEDNDEDTKMEDNDILNEDKDDEFLDDSIKEEYEETGNSFALDDVDIEREFDADEDNDNLYDLKVVE